MKLTPREKDKLLVSLAAMVARGRLERGVKLNHPEAIALITDFHVITANQCMEGIPEMIHDVQVEATFPDGTKLVTVHHPIRKGGAS
ncbi:MAG: urease subunit gamma [Alphaproteobacteria bacterium]|nr:urease subunit gamma [Alphaproteobacteria bacterium]